MIEVESIELRVFWCSLSLLSWLGRLNHFVK